MSLTHSSVTGLGAGYWRVLEDPIASGTYARQTLRYLYYVYI